MTAVDDHGRGTRVRRVLGHVVVVALSCATGLLFLSLADAGGDLARGFAWAVAGTALTTLVAVVVIGGLRAVLASVAPLGVVLVPSLAVEDALWAVAWVMFMVPFAAVSFTVFGVHIAARRVLRRRVRGRDHAH